MTLAFNPNTTNQQNPRFSESCKHGFVNSRRYIAEILLIRRKTPSKQTNQDLGHLNVTQLLIG